MDINFELYKVFYHVAKNLSFSAASHSLFISQSAVSQSIKLLENKLQTRLFIRSSKQVKLTQEGQILFRHIEQAFNFIKTGERSIEEINHLQKGQVRIGASDTICKYHLLPYFKKFNQLYPQIRIQVINRTSSACIDLLRKSMVDIAVINIPLGENFNTKLTRPKSPASKDGDTPGYLPLPPRGNWSWQKAVKSSMDSTNIQRESDLPLNEVSFKNLRVKQLKLVQDLLVAGNNFSHLKNREISLKELINYPILMLEKNSVTRGFLDSFLKQHGFEVTPEIELGSVDLLIELAKIGLGISFVIKEYVQRELDSGQVFALNLKENIPPRPLGFMTQSRIPLPLAAQKFIDLLSEDSRS